VFLVMNIIYIYRQSIVRQCKQMFSIGRVAYTARVCTIHDCGRRFFDYNLCKTIMEISQRQRQRSGSREIDWWARQRETKGSPNVNPINTHPSRGPSAHAKVYNHQCNLDRSRYNNNGNYGFLFLLTKPLVFDTTQYVFAVIEPPGQGYPWRESIENIVPPYNIIRSTFMDG
jgi:hypothetical protein